MTPDAGVAEGMRSQLERRRSELDAGVTPIGWKIGVNVPAVQEALGLSESVVGYLTSEKSLEAGAEVDVSAWNAALLEPEVAIRVGPDGGVGGLAPAIELVDIDLPFEDIEPILAGNIFHRAVVFGDEIEGVDVANAGCRVLVDGEETASAQFADDPSDVIAHVKRFLAEHDAELAPGDRIIAGSITPPQPVPAGSAVEVEIDGLGSVGLRFS